MDADTLTNLIFYKLDGAGNDFVGLDWRGNELPGKETMAAAAKALCSRYHGVGADGLIILLDAPEGSGEDFFMRYYNADGSLGEMCGNGARCAAVFAHRQGAAGKQMCFLTDAGTYRAEIVEGGSRVYFPNIEALPERRELAGPGRPFAEVDYLVVGVPHAVAFVEELELLDIDDHGRAIRFDPALKPAGANANFAEMKDGTIHVRTYERGVEGETQACGTGAVAVACCYARAEGLEGRQRFTLLPTGRLSLNVEFTATPEGFQDVVLEGPARLVFRGEGRLDKKKEVVDY